jgi:WD40 repeat protein
MMNKLIYAFIADATENKPNLTAQLSETMKHLQTDYAHTDDESVHLIFSALSNSEYITDQDPSALAHQLVSRLMPYRQSHPDIQAFTDAILKMPNQLFPINPDTPYLTHNPAGTNLLRTMTHEDTVRGALLMADGRILSWAGAGAGRGSRYSRDNTLRLWTIEGHLLHTLTGHLDSVVGAIEMTDGRILSWSMDKTLRMWDSKGNLLLVLNGHTDVIAGARQLSDGRILSWGADHTLRLWDDSGNPLHVFIGHTKAIIGALEMPDGRILSWGYDSKLHIWDAQGNLLHELKGHDFWTAGALILSDGRILSYRGDNRLRLWDNNGVLLHVLKGHRDAVHGANLLPDGQFMSWSVDTARLWDAKAKLLHAFPRQNASVQGMMMLPNGRFVTYYSQGKIALWTPDYGLICLRQEDESFIDGALPLPDSRFVTWSINVLRLWSIDGDLLATFNGHHDFIDGVLLLPNECILSWGRDNTLRLWDINGQTRNTPMPHHNHSLKKVYPLADGRFMSYGHDMVHVWDVDSSTITTSFDFYKPYKSGQLQAWAKKQGIYPTLFEDYPDPISANRVARDDNKLIIYDVNTRQPIYTYYADATISTFPVVMNRDDGFVVGVGDNRGHVYFLRWRDG